MGFLLQNDHHISWGDAWALVSFPIEHDLLPVLHSFINVNFQDLALRDGFFPLAAFTPILLLDNYPLSSTIAAHGLKLLHHSDAQLLYPYLNSLAFTGSAGLAGTLK